MGRSPVPFWASLMLLLVLMLATGEITDSFLVKLGVAVTAGPPTLYEVAEAVRRGRTDDPGVDACARTTAARQLRRTRWKLVADPLWVVLLTVGAFLVPEHGAERIVLMICWVLNAALRATDVWQTVRVRRRAHAYLHDS